MSRELAKRSLQRRRWIVEHLTTEGGYSTVPEVEQALAASGLIEGASDPERLIRARLSTGRMLRQLAKEGSVVARKDAEGRETFGVTAKCEPLRCSYDQPAPDPRSAA